MKSNFERLIEMVGEVFDTRNDPDQLQITESDRNKLGRIHPSTMTQFADEKGPGAWMLLIPTTQKIMNDFTSGKISENQILQRTEPATSYDCIYLCSAMVLPEYRNKGIANNLCLEAINTIRETHPIKYLFVWPFTKEGNLLSKKLAEETGLELKVKKDG